ncbi:MAG TPA: hypothetical protein VEZ17_09245 [Chitinophagaceae bacterium]|nr:hypothetical protein [Chitinophagaceae bacterium]
MVHLCAIGALSAQPVKDPAKVIVNVYPDSMLSDVSHHPVGINLDYFTDDDNYLKPRRRTADALKAMGVKFLRYPGGNKSDFYFFSKPPYEKSEPTLARTGKNATAGRGRMLKNNFSEFKFDVLDFDEFMSMCREIGAEPIVVVAADEYLVNYPEGSTWSTKDQLVQHAAEWVKYSNVRKKYNVKYWMIGNESWHKENINSTAQIYARDVVDFSKAMKAVDPSINIIPNGNTEIFWKEVLTTAAGHIDLICNSNYPVYNYRAGYVTYRDTAQNLLGPVTTALKAIDKYATIEDRRKLKLIVAEYGPFDWAKSERGFINNMGHNIMNFEMTGEQLCEPRVLFSCFWNTRWINNDSVSYSAFDALDKHGNFNANGYGLMIWGKFLGDKMVKTTSSVHVKTFASWKPQQKKLFLYLLNKSDQQKQVELDVKGFKVKFISQSWELAGEGPEDTKPVWRKAAQVKANRAISVNPTSITVVEFDLE